MSVRRRWAPVRDALPSLNYDDDDGIALVRIPNAACALPARQLTVQPASNELKNECSQFLTGYIQVADEHRDDLCDRSKVRFSEREKYVVVRPSVVGL